MTIQLQTQEAGTGDWVTIIRYSPGTESQIAHAEERADALAGLGIPSRVVKKQTAKTVAEWVAKAMYEAPGGGEPGPWPPPHPDDKAYWLERAEAAIAKYEEIR